MCSRQSLRCAWNKHHKPAASSTNTSYHDSLPGSHLLYGHSGRRLASSSSKRWQNRQGRDKFAVSAKVNGLKSRAAYKLLEINEKYKIFRPGQTVIDLGYAPGSWSQVAVDRTSPNGLVLGIDVIPARPPAGVSTIQGNFLSSAVQDEVKRYLRAAQHDRQRLSLSAVESDNESITEGEVETSSRSYLEQGNQSGVLAPRTLDIAEEGKRSLTDIHTGMEDRMVDVVLSDMSAPWEQTEGFWKRSLSNPYYRMMNTSGINFRDHAGSMDLCQAALAFAFDTLRPSGHLVCKYYQGSEEKALENRLRTLFSKVHRDKPESSRNESKEAYFVALRRKAGARKVDVFGDIPT